MQFDNELHPVNVLLKCNTFSTFHNSSPCPESDSAPSNVPVFERWCQSFRHNYVDVKMSKCENNSDSCARTPRTHQTRDLMYVPSRDVRIEFTSNRVTSRVSRTSTEHVRQIRKSRNIPILNGSNFIDGPIFRF